MPSQRERLKDIFDAALALNPEDRAAFLDRECNGDTELRQQVESLLAAAGQNARSSSLQPTEDISAAPSDASTTVIGPYHLLEIDRLEQARNSDKRIYSRNPDEVTDPGRLFHL